MPVELYALEQGRKVLPHIERASVALFGGSFDPFHAAHLAIAKYVLSCGYDYTIIMPAKLNPLKKTTPVAAAQDRLAMISRAIDGEKKLLLCEYEIQAEQRESYTYRSIRHIIERYAPGTPLGLILGSDSIATLAQWKNADAIFDQCEVLIFPRPGYQAVLSEALLKKKLRFKRLQNFPMSEISATAIRCAAQNKHSKLPLSFLHKKVWNYLTARKLYE